MKMLSLKQGYSFIQLRKWEWFVEEEKKGSRRGKALAWAERLISNKKKGEIDK